MKLTVFVIALFFVAVTKAHLPDLSTLSSVAVAETKINLRCDQICNDCWWFNDAKDNRYDLSYCLNNDLFAENQNTVIVNVIDTKSRDISSSTYKPLKGLYILDSAKLNFIPKNVG
jgi:hypothetical protein